MLERLRADRLVRVAHRLREHRLRGAAVGRVLLRDGEDARERRLPHLADRLTAAARALFADEADVPAEREFAQLRGRDLRLHRHTGLLRRVRRGRNFTGVARRMNAPRRVPLRLFLDVEQRQQERGLRLQLRRGEREQVREVVHHFGRDLPRRVVAAVVHLLNDECAERGGVAERFERLRPGEAEARALRRQALDALFRLPVRVLQFEEQRREQRAVAELFVGIVQVHGALHAGRGTERDGRGELLRRRDDLAPFGRAHQRNHGRVAEVREAERRAVLHVRVGVLKRGAERRHRVGLRDPHERVRRGFAEVRVRAVEQWHDEAQRARVAEFAETK